MLSRLPVKKQKVASFAVFYTVPYFIQNRQPVINANDI